MITLDANLPAEIVPLSWLLGVWEGSGVIDYKVGPDGEPGEHRTAEFGQRLSFAHDGLPYLSSSSTTWLLPGDGAESAEDAEVLAHVAELGYWRLARRLGEGDPGPGMLPGVGPRSHTTAAEVESLRNARGGFDLEVSIMHPTGVTELYLGQVQGPRIDLATDAVVRSSSAKPYAGGTRLYGLVESHLLWAWDIAAFGQSLRTHASARLAKVD